MEINSVNDYITHLQELNNYEIVCRDGYWLLYPDDENGCSPTNDKLDKATMDAIKNMGGLRFIGYVISHHSVSRYKARPLDINFEFIWELAGKLANRRFTSITKLAEAFPEYTITTNTQYDGGSYWGGSRYCKTIEFKNKEGYRLTVCYYYLRDMLLKNKLFSNIVISYCKLLGKRYYNLSYIPWINGKKTTTSFEELYYKQLPNEWSNLTPEKLFDLMEERIKQAQDEYKEKETEII